MKYILTAVFLYAFFGFSFSSAAQNRLPSFARSFSMMNFDYEHAYIKINDKEATYSELLQAEDSGMLKVELYPKKEAVKKFGRDIGSHGVILFTTRQNKQPAAVNTTEDSLSYYKEKGITAYIKPDTRATLGGDTTYHAWGQFLQRNLHANIPSEEGAPIGFYSVMLHFFVNEDGSLSGIGIDEDPGYGTGAEAIRVMSQSPAWQPALYKGKPIKAYQRQPLNFAVQEAQ